MKLLSFTEILGMLSEGSMIETSDGSLKIKVIKGNLRFVNDEGYIEHSLGNNGYALDILELNKYMWNILPKFVSLQEAVLAWVEGHTIRKYHRKNIREYRIEGSANEQALNISPQIRNEAKWEIVGNH